MTAIAAWTLLFLAAAPAFASPPRTYESQLSLGLNEPETVAIDSSNRVWVTDNNSHEISEFNPEGDPLPTIIAQAGTVYSAAVDHSNDDLYVENSSDGMVEVYDATGTLLKQFAGQGSLAVDNSEGSSAGRLYLGLGVVESLNENGEPLPFEAHEEYINGNKLIGTPAGPYQTETAAVAAVGPSGEIYVVAEQNSVVDEFKASGEFVRAWAGVGAPLGFSPTAVAVDPTTGDLLIVTGNVIDEFSSSGAYLGQITGAESFAGYIATNHYLRGIAVNSTGNVYLADPGNGAVDIFSSLVLPKVTYTGVSEGTKTSATLGAEVDPAGRGEVEACHFEYVEKEAYDPSAANPFGAGNTFVPCGQALPYSAPTKVKANITELTPNTPYRYRLVVSNSHGTEYAPPQTFEPQAPTVSPVISSDLTETTADLSAKVNPRGTETTCRFEYGPTTDYGQSAPCPHAEGLPVEDIGSDESSHSLTVHLTELQSGVTYHFRLVAENLYGKTASEDQTFNFLPPSCPNSKIRQLTRSSYLPDCRAYELVSPVDTGGGFLYPEGPNSPEATNPARLSFGEIFGSIPGAGSPPIAMGDLYVATRTDQGWVTRYVGIPGDEALVVDGPPGDKPDPFVGAPANTRSDTDMDKFLDWNDGTEGIGGYPEVEPSYTPHVWAADGESLGVWPTVPNFGESKLSNYSPDFTHYYFQSKNQIYDNDTVTNTVTKISTLANGRSLEITGLPSSESDGSRVPGSSPDGSRVLMSASGALYMRINDATTIDLSENQITHQPAHVTYVGMTKDASKVYFTSEEHLTAEDLEHGGASLYMWSELGEQEGHPLTLISKGDNSGAPGEPGNTGACNASWTTECGVVTFTDKPRFAEYLAGNPMVGSGISDNAIASESGDIYFFSPEQLDGTKGVPNRRNLYDYREGRVQYVTTFTTGPFCSTLPESGCSSGPVVRIQVTPSDSKMAFLTASPVTSYSPAGHTEMYSYEPSTESVKCVSCIPDGEPPKTDVMASSDGLFMTDDGRIFFSTGDALTPRDTDGIRDVYEFVEGRPQLISSGTGAKEDSPTVFKTEEIAGLVGVSADGTNVYFSTYDSLVPQDTNHSSLKFYDARTDGGFPYIAPAPPCEAAEECHGPGSTPPVVPPDTSAAELGSGGNLAAVSAKTGRKHKKKSHRRKAHRKHRAHGRQHEPRDLHAAHGGGTK